MATNEAGLAQSWKRPDEVLLIRLHRLKQKKKQLAARLSQNNNNNNNAKQVEIAGTDKAKLLEAKIAQKRKNPFAKSTETAKKPKTDIEPEEDSLAAFVNSPLPQKPTFLKDTPTKPQPAKLVLQPFDAQSFSKLLQQTNADDADDVVLEEQKFTKHLPMDWSLKTRVRFFCATDLPSTTLKTSQMASGLTSFVRCIDTQNCCSGLDISPATRFNQATYYWQHPYLPWMTLFPRNSKENAGITISERERKALSEDWDYSFNGIFQLLRARQCPYFYLCANTFTVLFRAAGTAGRAEIHALMTPTTRGIRQSLRQEGIEFSMPLKKAESLNKSAEGSFTEEPREPPSEKDGEKGPQQGNEDDEDEEDDWLESLGVDDQEMRKIQTAHKRKLQVKEMAEDFSDNSLILIEGIECQGFFSFLLNAKSTVSNVGRLAGVPPTILAPVAFPKATMQHLSSRSKPVRMDGVVYHSIEVKGIIMPSFLPYACQLLGETKDSYSATLASSNITLAFSKATQKLIEEPSQPESDEVKDEEEQAEQVFEQENLSDCGLLPGVIEAICRTGQNAVSLLERVCYEKQAGFAWS